MVTQNLYEKDFHAWTQEQAKWVGQRRFEKLDIVHLQEELQLMGASERRELQHRLEVLLMHLLKWKYQPSRQCQSWARTIKVQRNSLIQHLKDNPSLKAKLSEFIANAYENAVLMAADETNLEEAVFPKKSEWDEKAILEKEFFPS